MEIIGVVKDFHYLSVHHTIEPMCFVWFGPEEDINIKISSYNMPETIKSIKKEWINTYGAKSFEYSFLDELFDQQYTRDERGAKIISYFTILAIIIACMGLFALSSFIATRRTKEIGIRKTMGASNGRIFLLLLQEHVKWILVSIVIASPIAWWVMNKWLENFAYHIKLSADIFILAAMIALAITILTVIWQLLKTARANPIDALRYE